MASKKAATKREITVLVRYQMKKDCPEKGLHKGDVVLYIENDKGVRYYTTLRRNKVHSCTCPSRKTCYHITEMASKENARFAARKAAKVAQPEDKPSSPEVVSPEVKEVKHNITDISTKGALTRNTGFQLLKVS